MDRTAFEKITELIEDNKDNMTDADYMAMMNAMKVVHDKKFFAGEEGHKYTVADEFLMAIRQENGEDRATIEVRMVARQAAHEDRRIARQAAHEDRRIAHQAAQAVHAAQEAERRAVREARRAERRAPACSACGGAGHNRRNAECPAREIVLIDL